MQGRLEKGYILPGQADVIYSSSYVMTRLEQKRTVYLSLLDMLPKEIKVKDEANIAVQSLPSYNQHIEMLIEDIKKWRSEKFRVLILSGSKIRAERLAKDLNE